MNIGRDLEIKAYLSQLEKDKLFDKKSFIWEKETLKEVNDPLDSNTILEGRLGEFPTKRIITKLGLNLIIPLTANSKTFEETKDLLDEENLFQIRISKRILKLEKRLFNEYENIIEKANKSSLLRNIENTQNLLKQGILSQFEGFIDSDKYGVMLGNINILRGRDSQIFIFTYGGYGNYTDIKMEFNNIVKRIIRSINE